MKLSLNLITCSPTWTHIELAGNVGWEALSSAMYILTFESLHTNRICFYMCFLITFINDFYTLRYENKAK